MTRLDSMPRSLAATFAALLAACQAEPTVGSETHFLRWCSSAAPCGGELSCVCGVCAEACVEDADCEGHSADAVCVTRQESSSEVGCEATTPASCEVTCASNDDCAALGQGHRCDRGSCRSLPEGCVRGTTNPSEVAVLGDLFLAESGEVVDALEALAREAGSLSSGASYRDYSAEVTNPFGEAGDITDQYRAAESEGPARFVIFDAGGPDALGDCASPVTSSCPSLTNAVNGTVSLLAEFQAGEVEHALLFFYPTPEDAALAEKFDVLRPLLAAACEEHAMPCSFVDLRPTFANHAGEYLLDGGILPTTSGARATAEVLFSHLERECLAQ